MGQGIPPYPNYRPSPPPPHYMVFCNRHFPPECVYSGPSKSSYDYYNSDPSRGCSQCADEESERREAEARRKAMKAKRREEQRVRELQQELERKERQKLEDERQQREIEREQEMKRMAAKKKQEEQERIARDAKYLHEAKEEIVHQEIEKLKSKTTQHPITAFKRCNTVQVIKELGNQALKYGVAGQIISERVAEIKGELQTALQDDYKFVESEVERYEKYGQEMKSITSEFIDAFGAVFGEADDHQDQFDENAQEYVDADRKDQADMYKEDVTDNLDDLAASINNMKFKLLLMEQYYDKMKEDYRVLIEFIDTTTNHLEDDKIKLRLLKDTTADIRRKTQRDVFDGQENEEYIQKEQVEQNYVRIVHSTETKQVKIESKRYVEDSSGSGGRAIGAMIGGGIGTIAGGPVFGGVGILAGGLLGAAVGSLFDKKQKRVVTKTKYATECMGVTRRETRTIKFKIDQSVYDGVEQANAIDEIRTAMKAPIDNFIQNLSMKNESIKQQLKKFEDLEKNNKALIKTVDEFKENVDVLRNLLKGGKEIKDKHRTMLKQKWKETSIAILVQLKSMKNTNDT